MTHNRQIVADGGLPGLCIFALTNAAAGDMINLIRNQTFGREDGPVTESEKKRLAIAAAMKALLRSNPIEKITTEQILE